MNGSTTIAQELRRDQRLIATLLIVAIVAPMLGALVPILVSPARFDGVQLAAALAAAAVVGVVVIVAMVALGRRRRRLTERVIEPLERLVAAASVVGTAGEPIELPETVIEDLRVLGAALAALDESVQAFRLGEQQSRERADRLRLAQDLSGVGFVIADVDGHLREVNTAFARFVDRDAAELVGTPMHELVAPVDVDDFLAARAVLLAEDHDAREIEVRVVGAVEDDADPSWALVTMSCSRDDDGTPRYLMAQVQDITSRRAIAIIESKYRAELERSNAELEQFAYVTSHDLSEPLRVMSGFAALLPVDLGDDLDDDTRRHLEYITEAAARMQHLIDDLLSYSRVGRIDAPIADVDLAVVAADAVAMIRDDRAEDPVTFEIDALPVVRAAPTHVHHLMLNLVANAVKFRSTERPAVVRVSSGADQDGFATVYVDDNGIGIEPRHRDRIFRMFQRLHTRDQYPGTGMGLAICRKIVELYEGSLTVEDAPGGGTRFVLRLPLAPGVGTSE